MRSWRRYQRSLPPPLSPAPTYLRVVTQADARRVARRARISRLLRAVGQVALGLAIGTAIAGAWIGAMAMVSP